MKALLFLLLLPVGAFAQKMTAVEYNDKIIANQDKIVYKMLALSDYIGSSDATKEGAEALRKEMLDAAKSSIGEVETMKPFEGNDELRKEALNLFRFYQRIILNEYRTMIDLLFKDDLTEEDVEQLSLIAAQVTDDEAAYDSRFQEAQMAFALKHGLELEENSLQEEIDE